MVHSVEIFDNSIYSAEHISEFRITEFNLWTKYQFRTEILVRIKEDFGLERFRIAEFFHVALYKNIEGKNWDLEKISDCGGFRIREVSD